LLVADSVADSGKIVAKEKVNVISGDVPHSLVVLPEFALKSSASDLAAFLPI
jgi:hypothetical protein